MTNRRLKIEYIPISELKPYENNAKIHTEQQIEQIMESIEAFGMNDPIAISKENIIIEGHGRLLACKELGIEEVPIIRLDDLTDDERKAYTLIHNKLTMNTDFDIDILNEELEHIEIDMSQFGFDIGTFEDEEMDFEDDDGYYGDERERTNRAYNLDLIENLTNDFWQMPIIENDNFIPSDLIGFNYAKSNENKKCGIHFYVDDYQFERVWNYPEKYIEVLEQYECILSPDFSLYLDMPMPMKIWNIYRSRLVGQYFQSRGIKVIPTISWAEKDTFSFCFKGIPKGSIVSISTIGVKQDPNALEIWRAGVDEMIKQIEPKTILVYGGKLDYDYKDIEVYYFDNKVTENWQKENEELRKVKGEKK